MTWGSDSVSVRLRARGGRRGHAQPNDVSASPRTPDALYGIPQGQSEMGSSVDEAWSTLLPALAPHPTRRKASSGVITFQTRVVEPASEGVRRHR